jgi:hypothetical protein
MLITLMMLITSECAMSQDYLFEETQQAKVIFMGTIGFK